ncbi:MAG: hypothetical protein V3R85_02845 [Alphaproteobacteria bacterium]
MAENDMTFMALGAAAQRMGLTTDALRMRFRRGKIKGFRRDGRIFVFLPDGAAARNEQSEHDAPTMFPTRAEIDRLVADNSRLHDQQNRLLTLLEREQVLRQQLQGQLTDSSGETALITPPPELSDLENRLRETEDNFDMLKQAVSQLVRVVEERG